uniref:SPNS lysolipid transporter 1, lysophospholipid n=2 Tax=Eptatretus burgeri TaxID=7764 RepID=A0A8C4NAZ5_EPTBU
MADEVSFFTPLLSPADRLSVNQEYDSLIVSADDEGRDGNMDGCEADTERRHDAESPSSGVSMRRSHLVVAILFYINLLNYMDRFTVAGVLIQIQNFFTISDTLSGLLTTVFICSYMVLAPFFGYLGDRYVRKYIMMVGICLWSAMTLTSSFMPKQHFSVFLVLRGLVGVGEASYSTIAPTVIADLFTHGERTRMLSFFYFAIPVGSGLGYIVGGNVAQLMQNWQWALRITPALGFLAVILIGAIVPEPRRGAAERDQDSNLVRTSWSTDIKCLLHNPSFMWSSFGFTSVSFVTGALALWSPKFLVLGQVVQGTLQPCKSSSCDGYSRVSLIFGVLTCVSGVIGVGMGAEIARRLKLRNPRADPLVCAVGLLSSAPFLFLALTTAVYNTTLTYVFIFLGETLLSLNWAVVADILLYVVIPTRRATAESLQIVMSHLLGDAFSPYFIGMISDSIKRGRPDSYLLRFTSLEYSLLICVFVSVFGGSCFLINMAYIEQDRIKAERIMQGMASDEDVVVPVGARRTSIHVSELLS